MEKRYLIFISSTYEDLKEEREMVTRAILDLNCFPARMENFPAAGIPPKDLIEKVMKECDYFVLIIGDKYGSISESGKTFTEEEYNIAIKEGIPVIAFLLDDKKMNDESSNKLLEFRNRVKQGTHTIRTWTNPYELMASVATSLHNAINIHPRLGWVRAHLDGTFTDNDEYGTLQILGNNIENDALNTFDVEVTQSKFDVEENSDFWDKEFAIHMNIGFDYFGKHYEVPYSIKKTLKEWFVPIAQIINDSVSYVSRYGIIYYLQESIFNDSSNKDDFKKYVIKYTNRLSSPSNNIIYEVTKYRNINGVLPFIKGIEINEQDTIFIIKELEDGGLIEDDKYCGSENYELTVKGQEFLTKFVSGQ